MNVRRGFLRLMLLATLAWVTFVAYDGWSRMPRYNPSIAITQLADHCRYKFRVTAATRLDFVRYEAVAQYHRQRLSLNEANCRAFLQVSEGQVAADAARIFRRWVADQQLENERQFNMRVDGWMWNYLLHALAPPLFVWLLFLTTLWVGDGFVRRERA